MKVYRVVPPRYASDLSGEGARKWGGRWNPKGTAVLYTAENSSLALLEKLVHTDVDLLRAPQRLLTIEIPDHFKIKTINTTDLPKQWQLPLHYKMLQHLMLTYFKEGFHGISVPSAINSKDAVLVFDVSHTDYHQIEIIETEPVFFDTRLIKGD
ncbi:RES domain-containing protein [Dokdonia sinensis]|uniref:RES domain-containing protein n=1 Tax=Dokdonia sinensis TaxID=2479847 RepID=A0A3M0FUH8_9FLAO|nr:RES family NAD+ phosphorylase [Dokdonia sinensis]RMB56440.1 RES domain-containing protein [Dokdonia sinensis]